jgi:hypothetical protein
MMSGSGGSGIALPEDGNDTRDTQTARQAAPRRQLIQRTRSSASMVIGFHGHRLPWASLAGWQPRLFSGRKEGDPTALARLRRDSYILHDVDAFEDELQTMSSCAVHASTRSLQLLANKIPLHLTSINHLSIRSS